MRMYGSPFSYSSEAPFLCNRCDAINDSVFTGRCEPMQWSALTYLRRAAVGTAVDITCSILIDLSFFVAKERMNKKEPSVFGNMHDFFNSEPCIFRLYKYKKYHTNTIILILILIILIIITFIIRKYVKIILDSS